MADSRLLTMLAVLMRVGAATVVEWSHNGAVWVCPCTHGAAPKLFSTQLYADSDLRAPRNDLSVSRITHDAHGSWRPKLDSAIHDLTGIQLRDRYQSAIIQMRR